MSNLHTINYRHFQSSFDCEYIKCGFNIIDKFIAYSIVKSPFPILWRFGRIDEKTNQIKLLRFTCISHSFEDVIKQYIEWQAIRGVISTGDVLRSGVDVYQVANASWVKSQYSRSLFFKSQNIKS